MHRFTKILTAISLCLTFHLTLAGSLPEVVSTQNTEHFIWGDVCDGWWLKKKGDFTIISESMPPNSAEKKHYHDKAEQFFYVTEGELTFELDGKKFTLKQGEGITVPAKVVHTMWNTSKAKTTFLVISSTDLKDDRTDL